MEAVRPAERVYITRTTTSSLRLDLDREDQPGLHAGHPVGNVKDGKVTAFIPETKELSALEGVAADDAGNIYGGYTNTPTSPKAVPRRSTSAAG